MMKLYNEPNVSVAYASDALIPESSIPGIMVHHESHHIFELQEIVEKVGGSVFCEYSRHSEGSFLNERQFEEKGEKYDS